MDKNRTVRFYDGFKLLKEADDAVVIYTGRWHTYGRFEIHLPKMADYIKIGNRIMFDKDERKVGIIKYINTNDEGEVTIKGYNLLWMLSQRITVPDAGKAYLTYNAPVEDIMINLVKKNAVVCQEPKRNIPGLKIATSQGRGIKLSYQTRYDNLMTVLEELSRVSILGVCVRMDLTNKQDVFEVLEGRDKSMHQGTYPPVVFRRSYDNILSAEYTVNDADTRTCAYTAGKGEGADRAVHIVGDQLEGLERREMYVDARDVEDAADLPNRGQTKLAECVRQESFEAAVTAAWYKERWDIGDTVTVVDDETGIVLSHYISEIEETLDEEGYNVIPTFGIPEKPISSQKSQIKTDGMKGEPGNDGQRGEPGAAGADGITPSIGGNGNWFLGDKDTRKPSRGEPGESVELGETSDKAYPGDKGKVAYDHSQSAHDTLKKKGMNTMPSITEDTVPNWVKQGNSIHYFNTRGILNGQPSQYGMLLNMSNDGTIVTQLWLSSAGNLYYRTGNSAGWYGGGWRKVLDVSNFNNYALPLIGGTMTGNIEYNMGGTTRIPVEIIAGNANGMGVLIGAGGATVIGGGESTNQIRTAITNYDGELMIIGSDQDIEFYSNLQNGWAGRKGMRFSKGGVLSAPCFSGPLNGNASTATRMTTTKAGSPKQPVYFDDGKPVPCSIQEGTKIYAQTSAPMDVPVGTMWLDI